MFRFFRGNKRYFHFFSFFLGIVFLYPHTCFAHLLSITPTVPFPAQVFASSTTTATFTVTNTSKIPLTVVNQSEFPANLSVSSSNCGLLGAGQSCTLQIQLQAPAITTVISSTLKLWAKPSRDGVQHPILVQIVQPQPPVAALPVTFIAGGINLSGFGPPLLAFSSGLSLNWSLQTTGLPSFAVISGAACTGTGANVVCITTGNSLGSGFIAVASNGGDWTTTTYTLFGNATSATGSGSSAILAVVGGVFPPPSIVPPFLRISLNAGATFIDLGSGLQNGILFDVSCTGNGSTAICVAAGEEDTGTPAPYIQTVTINAGSIVSSTSQVITGLLDTGALFNISCTGSGSNAVCAALGLYTTNVNPLLIVSAGNGQNWSAINLTAPNVFLSSVNCTGNGTSALCVAVGEDDTGSPKPVLAVSRNGGATWALQTGGTFPTLGFFNDVSCKGDICVAGGRDDTTNLPLLMVSTDRGISWSRKSISGTAPANGGFTTVNCENGGTQIICIAAGESSNPTPFLAASTDSGNTWSYQTTNPSLPIAGVFNASGGTSFSKKRLLEFKKT